VRGANNGLVIVLVALLAVAPLGFPEAVSSADVFCDGIIFVDGIDQCVPRPGPDHQSTDDGGSNNG